MPHIMHKFEQVQPETLMTLNVCAICFDSKDSHTLAEQHNVLTPDQPCKCQRMDCFECMVGIEDGTAGHSKGKWYYYGDVACGIATDCQHKADAPVNPPVKFVFSSHQHESDDLIPMLTEEDFDNLSPTDADADRSPAR